MATSKVNQIPIEILASATDSYAQEWALERYGRVYVLSVTKMDQSTSPPSGLLVCPLTVNPEWLPSKTCVAMSVSQGGAIWNIAAQPTGLSGWSYSMSTDVTQRFAQLVWFK